MFFIFYSKLQTNSCHTYSRLRIGPLQQKQLIKMGCRTSKHEGELTKKQMIVGTLNYCAIMNSPFEFYCQDFQAELKQISTIFESLLPQYIPKFSHETFKWGMGKIDVKVRNGRYSPLLSIDVGIENSRFVTQERFTEIWDEVFDEEQKRIGQKFPNQEREAVRLYDLISFHSLLIFVYQIGNFQDLVQQDPALYYKKLKPFYQLSFLNEKKKLDTIVKNFAAMNIDIFFLQEYSKEFERYIDECSDFIKATDHTKDTMIIARKQSFVNKKSVETVLSKEQIQSLNWAGRTSFLCLDNCVLINAHLTSKTAKNTVQIEHLKTSMVKLIEAHPTYHFVLAGDLNSFLTPSDQLSKHFQMFPSDARHITTSKKRTMTQAQFNKGNKLIKESKDKIITNLQLKKCKILYIDGTEPKEDDLIPRNDHPFDHFVVTATISK